MKLIHKPINAAALIGACLLLSSCALFNKQGTQEPDHLTLICENLKQDIILNDGLNGMNDNSSSPTKAASFYKQYDQYHCDDVIAGKRSNPVKPAS